MKKITTYLFSIMLLFSLAIIPVYASDGQNVNFDLHSIVYDDGEAIDSVVLKTSNLEIDNSKITKDMFNVHATGTTVYSSQLEKDFLVLILNLVYNIVDYMMKKEKLKV